MLAVGVLCNEVHHAEAPRIVERHNRTVGELEDDVIVSVGRRGVCGRDAERARHAEVDEERIAGGQIEEQVFSAAAQRLDGLSLEPGGEAFWKRKTKIRTAKQHTRDRLAAHRAFELAADRFDLGEFGHPDIIASPPDPRGRYSCPPLGGLWAVSARR